MEYYTTVATDNVTLRAKGDCMLYLEVLADITNASMERNRDKIANHLAELVYFGQSTLDLD